MTKPNLSRRDVLRNGAVTTGILVLGGSTVVGTGGAARQGAGGRGFLTDTGLNRLGSVGNVVEIQYVEDIWLRGVQAACDSGTEADYQAYRVAEVDGNETAGLFVNPRRNVNTGTNVEFTEVNPNCGEGDLEHPQSPDGPRTVTQVTFGNVD